MGMHSGVNCCLREEGPDRTLRLLKALPPAQSGVDIRPVTQNLQHFRYQHRFTLFTFFSLVLTMFQAVHSTSAATALFVSPGARTRSLGADSPAQQILRKTSMNTELQSRRKLITGAAAGAMAAAVVLSPRQAQAQATGIKRSPLNTPIKKMLNPDAAKMLTPAAALATKGDMAALRAGVLGMKGKGPVTALNVKDVESIEKAFDSHEFAEHSRLGYKVAGAPLGMATAAAQDVDFSIACCCCCPCCSCAAATRP